jgi:plastocyanin
MSNLDQPEIATIRRSARRPVRRGVWSAISVLLPLSGLLIGACSTTPVVGNATGSPAATVGLAAANLAFDRTSLQLPAGVVVALTLDNRDPGILHNVAVYPAGGGDPVFRGDTFAGIATRSYLLGPLIQGSYRFVCDVHPTMSGTLAVTP